MKHFVLGLFCLLLAACGGTPTSPPATGGSLRGDLQVSAAASLTDAFKAAGDAFHKDHPGVILTFNFGGTPTLLTQIQQGAPADVFASADQPNMQRAVDSALVVGTPTVFTRNRLAIVVGAGNPRHITGLADLARPDVLYIAEAPTVPAGKYGAQVLAAAGVKTTPRSLETDVRSVVSKVSLGEADAGIVYVTDVRAGGAKVGGVDIPLAQNVVATYPIAIVRGSHNAVAAQAFIDFLLTAQGQALLATFGFASA